MDRRIEDLASENVRLQQAIAARDSFLAVAAHELRNPMTPILGRVTLLKRSVARGDLTVDDIVLGLDRIERLVMQFIKRATTLLDVSRSSADRWDVECGPVAIVQLVAEVVDGYRPSAVHAGASLHLDVACASDTVAIGDRLGMEQVVENLLSNAIKYGGSSPVTVTVSAHPAEGIARIAVRDAGPGIPAAHHARIFEQYERVLAPGAEVSGYGVGLWIVRNLCEAMGGGIAVASQPGEGATFCVSLPLATNQDVE
jgi:two-component system OmpR family sensor kinase